jgi:hypothetical protein
MRQGLHFNVSDLHGAATHPGRPLIGACSCTVVAQLTREAPPRSTGDSSGMICTSALYIEMNPPKTANANDRRLVHISHVTMLYTLRARRRAGKKCRRDVEGSSKSRGEPCTLGASHAATMWRSPQSSERRPCIDRSGRANHGGLVEKARRLCETPKTSPIGLY